jgi:hypothetical protein
LEYFACGELSQRAIKRGYGTKRVKTVLGYVVTAISDLQNSVDMRVFVHPDFACSIYDMEQLVAILDEEGKI